MTALIPHQERVVYSDCRLQVGGVLVSFLRGDYCCRDRRDSTGERLRAAAYEAIRVFSEHASAESSRLKERAANRDKLLAAVYAPLREVIRSDSQALSAIAELKPILEERRNEFVRNYEEV